MTESLEFFEDTFRCAGGTFSYDEVVHLSRYAKRTSVGIGLLPTVPVADKLKIGVYIDGRSKPIMVKNAGFAFTTGKLKDAYAYLAKRTFRSRLMPYLEQVHEHGYFDYSGLRFFPDADEFVCGRETFDLCACKFAYEPFEVRFKRKGFRGMTATASTLVDQDVFFALLRKFHGIRFG